MVTIWFESHATTTDNETKRASGWNDVDLSPAGRTQAVELTDRCKDRGISAIFCSDLQRAVKTAMPLANNCHIPMYVDERLRECNYGDMEGEPNSLIEAERPKRTSLPFPNGESYDQCMERMQPFFAWLKETFDGQTVLIIGHRATLYGAEHFAAGKSVQTCIAEGWKWQPGWKYQLS